MIVLVPTRMLAPALVLAFLSFLLFLGGMFVSLTVLILFTAPDLLQPTDLWAIPAAVVTGLIMFWLGRQLFKRNEYESEGFNLFAMRRSSAWFVFFLMASAWIGGIWLGVLEVENERSSRLTMARNHQPLTRAATPAGANPAATRASALRLETIFYNSTKSTAVINGESVLIGGKVGEWRVKAIGPRSVLLQNAKGETETLLLK